MVDNRYTSVVGKRNNILLAEDDEFYAAVFQEKLTHAGFNVKIAENGELALEALRGRKYDLLLLDLIMPVKDGIETLKEIRQNELLKDLKVIVISTIDKEETFQQCKSLGVLSYLPKTHIPFAEAVEMVKNYIG